jgi:transcriptional regulator with XRE-family HTH domain
LGPRTPRLGALGAAIEQTRKKARLSQVTLSELSGLNRTHISGIERGIMNPSYQTLIDLAEALDTTAGTIVTLADRIHSRT